MNLLSTSRSAGFPPFTNSLGAPRDEMFLENTFVHLVKGGPERKPSDMSQCRRPAQNGSANGTEPQHIKLLGPRGLGRDREDIRQVLCVFGLAGSLSSTIVCLDVASWTPTLFAAGDEALFGMIGDVREKEQIGSV